MQALIGKTLAGYTVTEALGEGPTGETYAATAKNGGQCALKLVHGKLSLMAKTDPMWKELGRLGELSHPHIAVPTAADWTSAGRYLLVRDLLQGVDLNQALSDFTRLPPRQALLIVGQLCLALEAAHEQEIVHGAVKPRNIFLLPRGSTTLSTRLLDFGSPPLLEPPGTKQPSTNASLPDASYLAPEQFTEAPTAASDQYALGVVLFEVLSGRRPFVGNFEELAKQHRSTLPRLPDTVPSGLRAVIARALAKDPAERYADVGAFREALEAWAAKNPPELDVEPIVLFDGDLLAEAVDREAEKTVRVSVDELSELFEEDEELEAVASDNETTRKEPTPLPPEDAELAALAEEAAAPLRSAANRTAKPRGETTAETLARSAEEEEAPELPQEKSVKAFVAGISPKVPARKTNGRANGESMEAALDQFVTEAKAWGAAIPKPVIDDQQLAKLAKFEEPKPEPAPQPAPVPRTQAPATPAHATPLPAPAPRKSPLGVMLLSFVIGGAIVFGVMKLQSSDTPSAANTTNTNAATTDPAPTAAAGTAATATGEPAAAETAANTADDNATATAGGADKPAGTDPAAVADKAAADETKAAADKAAADKAAADQAAADQAATDQAAADKAAADKAATEAAAKAAADKAAADKAAADKAAADKAAADKAAAAKVAADKAAARRIARAAARKRKARKRVRRRSRAATKRTAVKRVKKRKPRSKKKKAKSDWVDPFSQ